jgi:hypothetical protein
VPTIQEITGQVAGQLPNVGLPASVAAAVLSAIDMAGFALTPKAGGDAVAVVESAPVQRTALAGNARGWACSVRLPCGTRACWLEFVGKDGTLQRLPA